ncbi:hypothetical protein G7B40_016225 [Aetokthonos hydrillicola Thurmond2011]|jgi:hypothetical protein|uniref:Uncharacterized protein n=1 Tax=Aetokthonos hydrillicola Thurmond2011 TaxID=2712845 RepID=A0AAP5IAB1_9CYAN|nr:hypothetical protein [Aetokthonos hydrillicola]MBO3458729.1 hypothetical protein [Aetokthonos hydrillicola CCALA 1050]MBW4585477.1 hypothetical protein [Aetokthonos hydrillicola CCALA 1050]MDR9896098.1 hypothetical protein [Aetokthonos hydrillicola Thurmond2011]
MTDIQVWAFLVGCNRYLDYRTIVAPDFMCDSKTSSLLAEKAGGNSTPGGIAYYREIHSPKDGDLTLVFRVIAARAEDIGIEGQGVLKDSFGREIDLIEGVVFRKKELLDNIAFTEEEFEPNYEKKLKNVAFSKQEFESIHKKLVVYYHKFWQCTRPESVIPSEPSNKNIENNVENKLELKRFDEYFPLEKEQSLQPPPIDNLKLQDGSDITMHSTSKNPEETNISASEDEPRSSTCLFSGMDNPICKLIKKLIGIFKLFF